MDATMALETLAAGTLVSFFISASKATNREDSDASDTAIYTQYLSPKRDDWLGVRVNRVGTRLTFTVANIIVA